MRLLSFGFLLILSLNIAAQSPAVSRMFTDGTKHATEERFEDALKLYKNALFAAENEYAGAGYRARLHYNIGVCYFRTDRFEQAVKQFKLAILLKSDYARAHYALGMAKAQMQNWKDAAASFEDLLKIDPKNGEAWFDLAFANIAMKDFETAEKAFARSITFGSIDSALSHNNIGVILAIKGDLTGAEKQFETAIDLSTGRLYEAKRNLEFCRSKRIGKADLVAGEFQYAGRKTELLVRSS